MTNKFELKNLFSSFWIKLAGALGLGLLTIAFILHQNIFIQSFWTYLVFLIGAVFLLFYLFHAYPHWVVLIKRKSSVRNLISSMIGVIFIMIMVALYYLSLKYPNRIDFTEERLFSLSIQTQKVLNRLKDPIQITVWAKKEDLVSPNGINLPNLLEFYRQEKSNLIDVRYFNPDKYPLLFKSYELDMSGGIGAITINKRILPELIPFKRWNNLILDKASEPSSRRLLNEAYSEKDGMMFLNRQFQYDFPNKKRSIIQIFESAGFKYADYQIIYRRNLYKIRRQGNGFYGEEELTSKIVNLMDNAEQKRIGLVQGHGEKQIQKQYSILAKNLKVDGYDLEPFLFNQSISLNERYLAILIAGPKKQFKDSEIKQIRTYLSKGGKMILLLDPQVQYAKHLNKTDSGLLNLDKLLADYGIKSDSRFVYDENGLTKANLLLPSRSGQFLVQAINLYSPKYQKHPITQGLIQNNIQTRFLTTRAFQYKKNKKAKIKIESLLKSSSQSWLDNDKRGDQIKNKFDASNDLKGQFDIALAITKNAYSSHQRIVLIGDSDFLKDQFANYDNGRDFFLNALAWTVESEGDITIRPKVRKDRRIHNFGKDYTLMVQFVSYIFPFLIIVLGIIVYRSRRRFKN